MKRVPFTHVLSSAVARVYRPLLLGAMARSNSTGQGMTGDAHSPDALTARNIQRLIASIFLGLGGWCLIAPASVVDLAVRPEHASHELIVLVCVGAFGAQACLAGLFAALSRFTRTTFLGFGIALLPFFVFDWWFYSVEPLFNEMIAIDAVGNVVMLALCARTCWLLRDNRG